LILLVLLFKFLLALLADLFCHRFEDHEYGKALQAIFDVLSEVSAFNTITETLPELQLNYILPYSIGQPSLYRQPAMEPYQGPQPAKPLEPSVILLGRVLQNSRYSVTMCDAGKV
jgi:hypothetical protein